MLDKQESPDIEPVLVKLDLMRLSIERMKLLLMYDRHIKYRKNDTTPFPFQSRRNDFTISRQELEEWVLKMEIDTNELLIDLKTLLKDTFSQYERNKE